MKLSMSSIFLHSLKTLCQIKHKSPTRMSMTKQFTDLNIPDITKIYTDCENIRTYCLTDLHADTIKKFNWIQQYCTRHPDDITSHTVMILPGDLGSEINRLEQLFNWFISQYNTVCYVPGNHELWRRGTSTAVSAEDPDQRTENSNRLAENSIEKFHEILVLAQRCGVHIGPVVIESRHKTQSSSSSSSPPTTTRTTTTTMNIDDNGLHTNDKQGVTRDDISEKKKEQSNKVYIVPLYSWYHANWDQEPELTYPDYLRAQLVIPFTKMWSDFLMCSWPETIISSTDFISIQNNNTILAEYFAALNKPFLEVLQQELYPSLSSNNNNNDDSDNSNNSNNDNTFKSSHINDNKAYTSSSTSSISYINTQKNYTLISFSHFVPRQELCPEKRFLMDPMLPRVIGSVFLEHQIRQLQSDIHLFGHTHIPIDMTLDNIRYIQWPLGYSREKDYQCAPIFRHGPLHIHDSILGIGCSGIPTPLPSKYVSWTVYYEQYKRDPSIVNEIAPWVQRRLDCYRGLIDSALKGRATE